MQLRLISPQPGRVVCCLIVAARGALPADGFAFPAKSILIPRDTAGQLSEGSTQGFLHQGIHLSFSVLMNLSLSQTKSDSEVSRFSSKEVYSNLSSVIRPSAPNDCKHRQRYLREGGGGDQIDQSIYSKRHYKINKYIFICSM